MSKRIEKRFKDVKLLCNRGKGKEVRRVGKRKMLATERQGEERKSETSSRRIASVAVPPTGTEGESQEPCWHTEYLL
jgi:hypothetical protein